MKTDFITYSERLNSLLERIEKDRICSTKQISSKWDVDSSDAIAEEAFSTIK